MRDSPAGGAEMLIPLTLTRDLPLQQQLYDQLRTLVQTGRLQAGMRLPSSRMLAEQFAVSRVTVLLVYERLIAEGLLDTAPARGTFVAHAAPRPAETAASMRADVPRATQPGRPDPALFPMGRWRNLLRHALDAMGAQTSVEYPAGTPALRNAIAGWLSISRAVAVSPEQIVLLRSHQQALHLMAHLMRAIPGDVVIEDPCDAAVASIFSEHGATLVRVPVDAAGVRVDALPAAAGMVHVSPSHHHLLGASLSDARRGALLDWARRTNALILEDDAYGELGHGAAANARLKNGDVDDHVVLLGDFHLTLGPWLKLAYLVVPRRLTDAAVAARLQLDSGSANPEESALAGLLEGGFYARHVHRLGKIYASRRAALLHGIRCELDPEAEVWGTEAGLNFAWLPSPRFGAAARIAALARGCGIEASSVNGPREAVLLGFATLTERQIEQRVARLAQQLRAQGGTDALAAG